MSWCDKLASTPTVGFYLTPYFASTAALTEAFSPIFEKLVEGTKFNFDTDQSQPFNFVFTTNDGFNTAITPIQLSVAFVHRLTAKVVSGGPPQVEMLSKARPFTELLPEVSERLIDAVLRISNPDSRAITRVGIVSKTDVDESEAPPGVLNFIDYMAKPWGKKAIGYNFNIATPLDENSKWSDRCVHTITRVESSKTLTSLTFDWQRTFENGLPITQETLTEVLTTARKAALAYFEDVAEGTRFDV